MLPTHIAAEAAKGLLGATRAGGDHHRHGQGLSAAPGPPGRLSGAGRRFSSSLRAAPLAQAWKG